MLNNNLKMNNNIEEQIGELQSKLKGVQKEIRILQKEIYRDECCFIELKQKQYYLEQELQKLKGGMA